jgi:uncharacterized protein (TIGR00106 family)
MPIMEISIVPLGTNTTSVSSYLITAMEVLTKEKDIKYELSAMGTIIEADSLARLFELARKMHESVLNMGIKRVVTTIKIDDRKDKKLTMAGKIKSLQKKLG